MMAPSGGARKPSCRPTFGKVIPCSRSYKTDSRLLALQGSCFVLELVGIDITLLEPLPERYESWRCRLSCLLDGSEDTKRSGWDVRQLGREALFPRLDSVHRVHVRPAREMSLPERFERFRHLRVDEH